MGAAVPTRQTMLPPRMRDCWALSNLNEPAALVFMQVRGFVLTAEVELTALQALQSALC